MGATLVLVLLVSAILLSFAVIFLGNVITAQRVVHIEGKERDALAVAEAGIEQVRAQLADLADWRVAPADFGGNVGEGQFTVKFSERDRDEITVTSSGTVRGCEKVVRARLRHLMNLFKYCRAVAITNNTASPLSDYQVRLRVAYAPTRMQNDFDDLRFFTEDGESIPYWLSYYADSTEAFVWVKVPSIPASGSTTIYMCYGNPTATSESDITKALADRYTKYDITYGWTDRVSSSDIANGDDAGAWVTLPFQFPYYRVMQTNTYACSNGYLSFTDTYGRDWSNSANELQSRWMIAPFWDDLRTDRSGGIVTNPGIYVDKYTHDTVLTFETTAYNHSNWSIKFQAILHRCGDIRINLDSATRFNKFSPTLGISRADAATAIDITSERAMNKSWLFALRKYVEPEPTVTFGDEERLIETKILNWRIIK